METERLESFGTTLAHILERRSITQTQLAEKVGTAQPVISAITKGRRQCGLGLATKIAEALQIRDEQEKITFLKLAKQPKWRGMGDGLHGDEALLYDIMVKKLAKAGIRAENIEHVLNVTPQLDTPTKIAIMLKDGSAFTLTLDLARKSEPVISEGERSADRVPKMAVHSLPIAKAQETPDDLKPPTHSEPTKALSVDPEIEGIIG